MDDMNVVIAGTAGEGIQTIGETLARAVASQGYAVFTWQEYESRIRGGQNSYAIRIGETPQNAPLEPADVMLALNDGAARKYTSRLRDTGTLIAEKEATDRTITIPFMKMAHDELNDRIYANTIAAGALAGVIGLDLDALTGTLAETFAAKDDTVIKANARAATLGYDAAKKGNHDRTPKHLPSREERYYLLSGNETVPLAAAYAGCSFIAAYPMTPSTGIISYIAKNEDRLGIFAEQAEDEIAAVNMAIGASFAGTRAMTATSGGGFALMTEGVSLAGMTETPLVIVLAQRPGPATGLPTRTAQGELLFAVNAGHGEFPKMVMAPADPYDAFHTMVMAFNRADRYQMPVIVLTDHFLADSSFSFSAFDLDGCSPEMFLADPGAIADYRRYAVTKSGISPRLAPGQSAYLVGADSDEHDEEGHITEDLAGMATAMMEKRLRKMDALKREMAPPVEEHCDDATTILVGWGSTRGAIREAVHRLREDGEKVGMLHFTELWPLPEYTVPAGKTVISVENNATGQIQRLLRGDYDITFQGAINRTDGLPLTAEYIRSRFNEYAR